MSVAEVPEKDQSLRRVARPRPGHADLVGGMKYHHRDLRNVLERSSARETTMRVAIGAIAKKILEELDIIVAGHVICLGGIKQKYLEISRFKKSKKFLKRQKYELLIQQLSKE